ncbi:ECF transporter S component [Thermatribacter velox]|jgi:uncharacterized membrane protein|uniref:ECF transporter S component n=1 Tax=Thermatribacter velox TaxID=3039681 RepID=A0ABZ2YCN5_9BACT
MIRKETLLLAVSALGVVVVFLATLLHVPLASHRFGFHLGEAVIFLVSAILGPFVGAITASLGSVLADLQMGYLIWVPFTLLVKAGEGYIIGELVARRERLDWYTFFWGASVMVGGYGVSAFVLFGWPALLVEVPVDVLQCLSGFLIACFIYRILCLRFPRLILLRRREWKPKEPPS